MKRMSAGRERSALISQLRALVDEVEDGNFAEMAEAADRLGSAAQHAIAWAREHDSAKVAA